VKRISKYCVIPGLLLWVALPALPCTCVREVDPNARTAMSEASVVFRGTVVERRTLPQRAEMRGRGRHAITFHVDEYWKGNPGRTVIIYGVDDGTDCLGDGGYVVGKNYLVYAVQQEVQDFTIDGTRDSPLWYGWTDVLPKGTKMLVPPTACMLGGETSTVRKAIRQLGKGRQPAKE
jgi:hypothetical protein